MSLQSNVFYYLKKSVILLLFVLGGALCVPFQCTSKSSSEISPEELQSHLEDSLAKELEKKKINYEAARDRWVDSLMQALTPRQRLGQLFMVAAYSNSDETHYASLDHLIEEYHIGGLIFFQGGPYRQSVLTNRYQSKSKIPLLIATDAEWGLGMRLDSTMSFPRQMILGAMNNDSLVYEMGLEIARQCKRIGVHINFAPVVDINSNPLNPVIGTRSFGENPLRVTASSRAYMKGMQHGGLLTTLKHFPGHGDTDSDSHHTLPLLKHSKERLRSVELYPFEQLFKDSASGVMVAHLHIPAYDSTKNIPTTLSPKVVQGLLKDTLGFEGLIFTDAMNMKGVSAHFKPGEADVKALVAGNDVLLYPYSVSIALDAIEQAIKDSILTQSELDKRVRKVLRAKYTVGLHEYKPIVLENIGKDLHTNYAKALNEKLHQKAITVVKNDCGLIPFQKLDTLSFASVVIGMGANGEFQNRLSEYAPFDHYQIPQKNSPHKDYNKIFELVKNKKVVIVGIYGVNIKTSSETYGISASTLQFIKRLQGYTHVIPVVFGNPYSLKFFENSSYLVCAYTDDDYMSKGVPQVLFGALPVHSKLPVSACSNVEEGEGFQVHSLGRLQYTDHPESLGINSSLLAPIDEWVKEAIAQKMFPGCQIWAAKKGTVFYRKNFGTLDYDNEHPVTDQTVYDLASVSKVLGTLPAVMKLNDKGSLALDDVSGKYLQDLIGTGKDSLTIRALLAHQAGLMPDMPGWFETASRADDKAHYYRLSSTDTFCVPVTENLYAPIDMEDFLWSLVKTSPMRAQRKDGSYGYRYSDVGFFFLKRIVETVSMTPLNIYTKSHFYQPLGLSCMGYLPLQFLPKETIAPTEQDQSFRGQVLQGVVHDYSASMMGGVGGNAGLFSNAHDATVMMQMFLQQGYYGGEQLLDSCCVGTFNKKYYSMCRRGLGWDKPIYGKNYPSGALAAPTSFGHSGFTGAFVWADPTTEVVYVFFCNRIFPSVNNRKLINSKLRQRIQDQMYLAMQSNL